jgi:hypothetical protein
MIKARRDKSLANVFGIQPECFRGWVSGWIREYGLDIAR